MNCPNINIQSVRDEFNEIISAFGGEPMSIEEFKSKDVRNVRSGVNDSAMQIAYYVWDKTNGEGLASLPEYVNSTKIDDIQRIRDVVNNMMGAGSTTVVVQDAVKQGVPELFESSPELAKIGTEQQYSQYLDTIFPDSKVKDIVYRGAEKSIESHRAYSHWTLKKSLAENFVKQGVNLNKKDESKNTLYFALLDIKNLVRTIEITDKNLKEQGFDSAASFPNQQREDGTYYENEEANEAIQLINKDLNNEITVFSPEQIHILGSKQDVEGFKKFTKKSLSKETSSASEIDLLAEIKTIDQIRADVWAGDNKAMESIRRFHGLDGDVHSIPEATYNKLNKLHNRNEGSSYQVVLESTRYGSEYPQGKIYDVTIRAKDSRRNKLEQRVAEAYRAQFESEMDYLPLTREESLEIAGDSNIELQDAPRRQIDVRGDVQTSLLDQLFKMRSEGLKTASNRVIRTTSKLADKMFARFGVSYAVVSAERAAEVFNGLYGGNITAQDLIDNHAAAFYDKENSTAYIIAERLDDDTTIHEMFGHPFLDVIKSMPELEGLYNILANEAMKDAAAINAVGKLYGGFDPSIMMDELILYVMKKSTDKYTGKSKLTQAMYRFYEALTQFLSKVFGNSNMIKAIRPDASIDALTRWALFGTDKVSLVGFNQAASLQVAADKIYSKFSNKDMSATDAGMLNFRDALRSIGMDEAQIIEEFANENGVTSAEQLSAGVNARLNRLSESNILRADGSVAGKIEWTKNGNEIYIGSIEGSAHASQALVLMSAINSFRDSYGVNFFMPINEQTTAMMENIQKSDLIPSNAYFEVNHNGSKYYMINSKAFQGYNQPRFKLAGVSTETVFGNQAKEFLADIASGLKAQLRSIERSKVSTAANAAKIGELLSKIETLDEAAATAAFIDFAANDVIDISNKLKAMEAAMYKDSAIDNGLLQIIKKDFFPLYEKSINAINAIMSNPRGVLSGLPKSDLNKLRDKAERIGREVESSKGMIETLSKFAYVHALNKAGLIVESSTIDAALNTPYTEDKDISGMASFVFGLQYASKESLRALANTIERVNADVSIEMSVGDAGRRLMEMTKIFKEIKKKDKFATYDRLFEKSDGKYTGYLISKILHGKFRSDYRQFKRDLMDKYGLKNEKDLPIDRQELRDYQDAIDMWLSDNAERRFTPDYYKTRAALSLEARESLDAASDQISLFLKKNDLVDEKGKPDFKNMTPAQKEEYKDLKKRKQFISEVRYPDGSPKLKGSVEYNIAIEVAAFNKVLLENVKYKSNMTDYEVARREVEKARSRDEYVKWLKENTRLVYSDEFWDALSQVEKTGQSEAYQALYDARTVMLKAFRDADTMQVNASAMEAKAKHIYEKVKEYDRKLQLLRTKSDEKEGLSFFDVAEMVPTEEFTKLELAARRAWQANNDKRYWDDFIKKTQYIGANNKRVRYSQYSTMEPKDKSQISREPNYMWSELDVSSNYVNENYNENLAEEGIQPNAQKYDNTKAFEEATKDKLYAELRDKIQEAYSFANKKYAYLNSANSNMLGQIPGGFLRKVFKGDNLLSGLADAISSKFSYKPYDTGYGDYDSRDMFRADGSEVMFVETRFRKLLDNPNAISKDMLGSLALYMKAAVRYQKMTSKLDDIMTLLDGIKSTKVVGDGKFVEPGRTRMSRMATDYVESNVFGRGSDKYEVDVKRFWNKKDVNSKNYNNTENAESKARIAFAKPIMDFINYVRKINLAANVRAIVVNYLSAQVHLKIESKLGTMISKESYSFANKEMVLNMKDIMGASMTGMSDNKIIAMMRMFDIVRSTENDASNMHGFALGRTLATNFWYGPYTAGDFSVKGRMMIAVLANIKFYGGNFYTREQFISKFHKDDRSTGNSVFDNISENLYNAFEINDKGMLVVKDGYRGIMTADVVSNLGLRMNSLARKLDGTMSGAEKTKVHTDAIVSALLLHRGWLMNALAERFHSKIYSYDKGMELSGMYRTENLSAASKIAWKFLGRKISDIKSSGVTGLGSIENGFTGGQLYQAKRLIHEIQTIVFLSLLTTLIGRMVPTKGGTGDKKKDDETWQMWAYVFMLRLSMEMWALYSPGDVYSIIGNPTAAEGTIKNIEGVFGMLSDGSFSENIEHGRYKYKTKAFRSMTKLTPGWKGIYENILKPDLSATEKFTLDNMPSWVIRFSKILIDPKTEEEKRAKEIRQRRIKLKKDAERARKRGSNRSSSDADTEYRGF